ncbi:hypothetical protein YB2330_001096 [Saitoella coloradoensis]
MLVCRPWYHLIKDDSAWRAAFLRRFGNITSFPSLVSTGLWRDEYCSRADQIRKWERGRGPSNSLDSRIGLVDSFHVTEKSDRVIIANSHGIFSVADYTTGKVAKDLLFAGGTPTSAVDMTTYSLVPSTIACGFSNGYVGCHFLQSKATERTWRYFAGGHFGPVSKIWIASHFERRRTGVISVGAVDGLVRVWDVFSGTQVTQYDLGDQGHYPVTYIQYHEDKEVLVLCNTAGEVYVMEGNPYNGDGVLRKVTPPLETPEDGAPLSTQTAPFVGVDFERGYVFVTTGTVTKRVPIQAKVSTKIVEFKGGHEAQITAMYLDESQDLPFHGTSTSNPGGGARFFTTGDETGVVCVWNARDEVEDGATHIKPRVVIPAHDAEVTSLHMTPLVLVVGFIDGVVRAYDPLTGDLCRQINSKLSKKLQRVIEANAGSASMNDRLRFAARWVRAWGCKGVVAIGSDLKTWDFGVVYRRQGKRLPLGKKKNSNGNGNIFGKMKLQKEISIDEAEVRTKMQTERDARERRERVVKKYNGGLGDGIEGMTESEMIAYVTMISAEAETERTVAGKIEETRFEDEEEALREALRLSALEADQGLISSSPHEEAAEEVEESFVDEEVDEGEESFDASVYFFDRSQHDTPAPSSPPASRSPWACPSPAIRSPPVASTPARQQSFSHVTVSPDPRLRRGKTTEEEDLEFALLLSRIEAQSLEEAAKR